MKYSKILWCSVSFAFLSLVLMAPMAYSTELGVHLRFSAPEVIKGSLGDVLRIEGSKLHGLPGQPLLPVKPVKVLIPYGHELVGVVLKNAKVETMNAPYDIMPAQRPVPLSANYTPAPTKPDAAIYGSHEFFPAQWSGVASTQYKRGFAVATVFVYPLRYNPSDKRVQRLISADLVVNTAPGKNFSSLYRGLDSDRELVVNQIDVKDALASYPPRNGAKASTKLDPGDYKYLIITPARFSDLGGTDSLEALADYRAANGMSSSVVTLEWIRSSYDGFRPDGGQDDATRIRDFITDAYSEWGTEYVLLVGDADGGDNGGESGDDLLQARKFFVEGLWIDADTPLADYIPSDLYYACLDGSFDHDADGLYGETGDGPAGGEVDLMAEVMVGRAPADSEQEVRNFVAKTLAYEKSAGTWLQNVLMLGEWLFDGPVWGGDFMDDLIHGSSLGGVETQGFDSFPFFTCNTLYDRDAGASDSWGPSDLIPLLNASPHIVNHLGHSNEIYNMRLQTSQADALTNPKPFLDYSQGCYNGSFDNQVDESGYIYSVDCFAEHLVLATHGSFAVIANARYGWGGSGRDGVSQRFHREFWDAFFGEGASTIGQALIDSKEDNAWAFDDPYFRWVGFESNLFGDPAVRLKKNLGTNNPLIGIYPPDVEMYFRYGDNESQQAELTVANDGVGDLNWSVSSSDDWLSTDISGGVSGDKLQLVVDPSSLEPGTYEGVLTFSDANAGNSPFEYTVIVHVIATSHMGIPHVETLNPPTVDGFMAPGEWDLALPLSIGGNNQQGVVLYSMVVDGLLYFGVEDSLDDSQTGYDQMRLYFDKHGDGVWPPDEESSDEGEYLLLGGTAYWWLLFNDGSGLSGPDQPTSNPAGVEMDYGMQDGHRVYEMSVDLTQSMLDVGPTGTFSMLLWVANLETGTRVYDGIWPPETPRVTNDQLFTDNQSFFGEVDLNPQGQTLSADPRGLNFEAVPDRPAPDAQAVAVVEPEGGNIDYSVSTSNSWIAASPSSGTTPSEIIVSVDHTGMELGDYHGFVQLTSPDAYNSPYRIPIDLHVLPSPPHLEVDELSFQIVASKGAPSPTMEFTVSNTGGRPLNFICENAEGWLVADPAEASLAPDSSRTVTMAAVLDDLEEGEHHGLMIVSANSAENTPVTVSVDLQLLAEQQVPPVQNLSIQRRDGALMLTWDLPASPLVQGLTVRRDKVVAPAGPELGTEVLGELESELLDSDLTNGTVYCYSLYTFDQSGRYSDAVTGCAAPGENRAPGVPQPLSPRNGAILQGAPELMVDSVSDPDLDPVTVSFKLMDGTGSIVEQGDGMVLDDGRISYTISASLDAGASYTWQAMAKDELGAESDWSEAWGFSIRQANSEGGDDGECTECSSGGCGCSTDSNAAGGLWWLFLFALLGLRKKF